ncbi:MAG TPA: hypothetical protein VFN49_00670, partial [Candidatus Aquilonibacter sp.]|nr:hypothetical protein [Candidatus Aquilonibacter sp.]
MNTRFGIAVICVALLAASPLNARAQTLALTNADVIRMVQSGLGNETMIAAIAADPHNFDLSANGLISLRKAGVSDSVIQAMMGAKSNVPDVAFVDGATRLTIDASPTAVLGTSSAHSPIASELVQAAATEGLSLLHGPITNVVGNLITGIVGNLERPRTAAGVSGQWAIPSLVAAHILAKPMPAFDVRYDPAT